jgi:hypothetical protein
MLLYRGAYFTLQVMATVKLMPEQAARLALPHIGGEVAYEFPKISVNFKILRELGWVQPADYVLSTMTSLFLLSSLRLGPLGIYAASATVAAWGVLLAFRGSYFTLQVMAEIHSLPEETARLIIIFQRRP